MAVWACISAGNEWQADALLKKQIEVEMENQVQRFTGAPHH